MKGGTRAALAVWLSACFHGPLVATGLYRLSFDAPTHELFADHYVRAPFALWDPRWSGGLSVSSYPPLAHQAIALLVPWIGHEAAFGVVLLATLLALPLAVWLVARLFVPGPAAGAAAIVSVFLPAVPMTANAFGQLPTLVGLALVLVVAHQWTRYVERGGRLRLALVAALTGLAFTAHHATPMLLLPPLLLACFATLLRPGSARELFRRAGVATGAGALAGALALIPFWAWALEAPQQAFIPHLSRADMLRELEAQGLFFWAMYGALPALAAFGFASAPGRRVAICAVLAILLGVIGLGGTTPVPALLFGDSWQWLTYDRFALWAGVLLLPLAGLAVDRAWRSPRAMPRAAAGLAVASLAAFGLFDTAMPALGAAGQPRDLSPLASHLSAGENARWRYQTFGVGPAAARLGYMADGSTIDTAYFAARGVPELAQSGIGALDEALWWDPSGATLRRVLAAADRYSIRWAFVADPRYEPYLNAAGFRHVRELSEGIALWEKPDAPPLQPDAMRFGRPDAPGILWGVVPLGLAAISCALALAQHRRAALRRLGRAAALWGTVRLRTKRVTLPSGG